MAMSLKMARWIDQMGSVADQAARLVWNGRGDELIKLPYGTRIPADGITGGETQLSAIELLRKIVADYDTEQEAAETLTLDSYEPTFFAPEEIH